MAAQISKNSDLTEIEKKNYRKKVKNYMHNKTNYKRETNYKIRVNF